jgi:hypothetical protein
VLTVEPTSHAKLELSQLAFQGRPRLSCNSHNTAFVTFLREICVLQKRFNTFLLYLSWFSMRRQTKKILRCQCIIESYEAICTIIHMCIFLLLELIQMITWTSFEIDQTTYLSLVKSSSTLMTLLCRIWWSFDCQTAAALLRNRCLYNRVFPRFSLDSDKKNSVAFFIAVDIAITQIQM